ncbi:MAG TPA: hypothetical protein VJ962_02635 [Clostridia bacterium]|nr:hypothetical protein [Clostridia bacterium]
MKNEKGYYTLEASIIVPFVLIIVVFFTSILFMSFYKGYYETRLNQETIEKGYTIDDRNLKRITVNNVYLNKRSSIYQRKVDDDFLKGLLFQNTINYGKAWLDE